MLSSPTPQPLDKALKNVGSALNVLIVSLIAKVTDELMPSVPQVSTEDSPSSPSQPGMTSRPVGTWVWSDETQQQSSTGGRSPWSGPSGPKQGEAPGLSALSEANKPHPYTPGVGIDDTPWCQVCGYPPSAPRHHGGPAAMAREMLSSQMGAGGQYAQQIRDMEKLYVHPFRPDGAKATCAVCQRYPESWIHQG